VQRGVGREGHGGLSQCRARVESGAAVPSAGLFPKRESMVCVSFLSGAWVVFDELVWRYARTKRGAEGRAGCR
jgi:hypothetical protein